MCNACQPGRYAPVDGTPTCRKCQIGTHAAVEGSQRCDRCDIGTYADVEGATFCDACPAGYYSDNSSRSDAQTLVVVDVSGESSSTSHQDASPSICDTLDLDGSAPSCRQEVQSLEVSLETRSEVQELRVSSVTKDCIDITVQL